MNKADVQFLSDAIDSYGEGVRRRKDRERADKQQALENHLREMALALQQRSADASIAGAERDFGFRKERAGVEDARYADQTAYGRGRDTLADTRYADATAHSRERDAQGDIERKMELALRMQQANNAGGMDRVTMRGSDPTTGEEFTYQVPRSQFMQRRQPPVPMATVQQKMGDSMTSYQVPLADMERKLRASAYQSPYAGDIADLGRQVAEQRAEIAGGDTRTGFLGIAKSRQGVIDNANRKRLQLQAVELQDQLQKGIITQDEADRRANQLMGVR